MAYKNGTNGLVLKWFHKIEQLLGLTNKNTFNVIDTGNADKY